MKKKEDKDFVYPPLPLNLIGLTPVPPPIFTDPFGSYTGLTKELDEKPVQDADDL